MCGLNEPEETQQELEFSNRANIPYYADSISNNDNGDDSDYENNRSDDDDDSSRGSNDEQANHNHNPIIGIAGEEDGTEPSEPTEVSDADNVPDCQGHWDEHVDESYSDGDDSDDKDGERSSDD